VNALPIKLSPEVSETLGRTSQSTYDALTFGAKFLAALGAKEARTGSAVFRGIPAAERRKRRSKGKLQRAARRAAR